MSRSRTLIHPVTRPLIVGLTGGIGSGKTTVSQLFAQLGVEVIDADVISRALVAPGQAVLQQLIAVIGADYLQPDGALNRSKLRDLIFTDADAKQRVEALLHPAIRAAILAQIARSPSRWVLLSAPLLLENHAYDFVDRVLVVDVPEDVQISRTLARDHSNADAVKRIMASQLTRQARLANADEVIHNDQDPATLVPQVEQLFQRYQQLADDRQLNIAAPSLPPTLQ
jgi:dephospho-CoA kinase